MWEFDMVVAVYQYNITRNPNTFNVLGLRGKKITRAQAKNGN